MEAGHDSRSIAINLPPESLYQSPSGISAGTEITNFPISIQQQLDDSITRLPYCQHLNTGSFTTGPFNRLTSPETDRPESRQPGGRLRDSSTRSGAAIASIVANWIAAKTWQGEPHLGSKQTRVQCRGHRRKVSATRKRERERV